MEHQRAQRNIDEGGRMKEYRSRVETSIPQQPWAAVGSVPHPWKGRGTQSKGFGRIRLHPSSFRLHPLSFIRPAVVTLLCIAAAGSSSGCGDPVRGPVVFYLDGAGWYSSAASVKQGLRDAGYIGQFRTYAWSAYLGPAHDHIVTSKSRSVARGLARKIEKVRRNDPAGQINVMGLSAGTAVVLFALEQLPKDIAVDNVVLFSPSVSARHDLTKAMKHVRRNLYATYSPHDGILGALVVNADGKRGRPAGRIGFRMTRHGETSNAAYKRVINLPWRPSYLAFDWNGGHTSVTRSKFVATVIAPRMLTTEPYPLDRSVMEKKLSAISDQQSAIRDPHPPVRNPQSAIPNSSAGGRS